MRVIFKITNLINSKIYIGKSSNDRTQYFGSGKAIKAAIEKYGKHNFTKEILDTANTLSELNSKEKYWISKYRSYDPLIGYNRSLGGDGNWEHMTDEAKEQRYKNQLKTFKSDEFRQKKRENTLSYYSNPENKEAQSKRIKEAYFKLSSNQQEKIKKRLLEGTIKRWSNEENKKKASDNWKKNNPTNDPEFRKRLSENRKGSQNPAAKKCQIDGIIYDSIIDACKTLSLTRNIISNRLRSNKFPNYKKL
jgi:hypothetical protein